ncbi:entericidin A/B family lipoprotein [Paracoccus limosus]|jgi:predicted small secreted protein|uniref:Entericidin A/B family lipoprotein n=1 Tax=Paracoccus limosus TaxID=913252 RepID=A0A844H7U6_9RHOB|nr:entericidin A/B family lipoprotein [Paracoccus limosus]MTH35703.1 entericidin A/B family lipoprotein [Paracoccus limosus]
MRHLIRLAPLAGLIAISGCETIQGAGRDMQTAGQVLTQQGYQAQNRMGEPAVTPPAAMPGY